METTATVVPAAPVPPPPAAAAAPVPLTAVPAEAVASTEPKAKRKYTKRADKAKAPKAEKKAKRVAKAKAPKAEKKPKRVAGTKAQGQVAKGVLKFLKATAKEKDVTVGALVGIGVTKYAKSLGFDPEA
jgi:hypothetical protein